jgi:uncharacterized protein (DUF2249 family)
MDATGEKTLGLRPIPPKDEHPTIVETFDELDWGYLEEGPEVRRVRLSKAGETA